MAPTVLYLLPASTSASALLRTLDARFPAAAFTPGSWHPRFTLTHSLWRYIPQAGSADPGTATGSSGVQAAIQAGTVRVMQLLDCAALLPPSGCAHLQILTPPAQTPPNTSPSTNRSPTSDVQSWTLPSGTPDEGAPLFATLLAAKFGEGWVGMPGYSVEARDCSSWEGALHDVRVGELWGAGGAGGTRCKVSFLMVRARDATGDDVQRALIREFTKGLRIRGTGEEDGGGGGGMRAAEEFWWDEGDEKSGETAEVWCKVLRSACVATGVDRRGGGP